MVVVILGAVYWAIKMIQHFLADSGVPKLDGWTHWMDM